LLDENINDIRRKTLVMNFSTHISHSFRHKYIARLMFINQKKKEIIYT